MWFQLFIGVPHWTVGRHENLLWRCKTTYPVHWVILCSFVSEARLWKANLISLPGKGSSTKHNVYFRGQIQAFGGIRDDHIPFFQEGKWDLWQSIRAIIGQRLHLRLSKDDTLSRKMNEKWSYKQFCGQNTTKVTWFPSSIFLHCKKSSA